MAKAIRVKIIRTVTIDTEAMELHPELFTGSKVEDLKRLCSVPDLVTSQDYENLRCELESVAASEDGWDIFDGEEEVVFEIMRDDGWWVKE